MTPIFKHILKTVLLTILFFIIFAAIPTKYNLIFADPLAPFQSCTIIPNNPKTNKKISLQMNFVPGTAEVTGGIRIFYASSGDAVIDRTIPFTKPASENPYTVELYPLTDPGQYYAQAFSPSFSDPTSNCRTDFTVTIGSSPPQVVLLQPATIIMGEIQFLPYLQIAGLEPGGKYFIELKGPSGWDGQRLVHPDPDPDKWTAVQPGPTVNYGIITARHVCNDGRSGTSITCNGFFEDGDYTMNIFNYDPPANQVGSSLKFSVRKFGQKLTIDTDPKSPISTSIRTLKTLTIGSVNGVLSGDYSVDLDQGGDSQWKGGNLKDSVTGNHFWTTTANGKIVANNICDNGEANRPEGQTNECKDSFDSGIYRMTVRKNDQVVDTLSFDVAKQLGEGGKNPCSPAPGNAQIQCETALGIIPTNPKDFAGRILAIAIGLAGGIALIFMVLGSIKVLTSSGDQQKLNAGKDQIVAAVAGLLFLIFSVLILRFIGVDLFHLFTA